MPTAMTAVSTDPKHYVWWFPGSPLKIHLDLQLVQRLKDRLELIGKEASDEGLLFGRTLEGTAEILEFQPATAGSVRSIAAAMSLQQDGRSLVGYYRTQREETFHLTETDLSLAEECFPKPHHVFLMIHPNGFGAPNATFFFHDGDKRMADFAFLEFPFDPSLLAIEERERLQRSHPAVVPPPVEVLSPAISPAPLPHVAVTRKKPGGLLRPVAWICAMAMIFGLGVLFNSPWFRERFTNRPSAPAPVTNTPPLTAGSAPAPSPAPLIALHAKRQDKDLELTWNRESTWVATATSGVITIQDGNSKRQIPLDTAQVRSGSLLYSPASDQIFMQLSVTTPADTISESVMVVLPKSGNPSTYPIAPPPSSKPESVANSGLLSKASKPFTPPAMAQRASAGPAIPADPPSLKVDLAPATVPPGIVSQPAAPLAPPRIPTPQPPAQTPAQTPAQASPAAPQQSAPVDRYQPPEAVVKSSPLYPPELRVMIDQKKVIEVRVSIDPGGKVTKAEAVPQKNVSQFLVNAAVNAAHLWRFKPALRNDRPVPSEMLLQFVFDRDR